VIHVTNEEIKKIIEGDKEKINEIVRKIINI
jgi:hypothetical protein